MKNKTSSTAFYISFLKEFFSNIDKNYSNNYDYYRFGPMGIMEKLFSIFSKYTAVLILNKIKNKFNKIESNFQDFEYLYDNLNDDNSKDLLIKLVCYRILGYRKVRLPTNNDKFWENIKKIEEQQEHDTKIKVTFNEWSLPLINLDNLGYNLKMYQRASQINALFFLKQYEYHLPSGSIIAEKGDIVIDAGGCWGDTALYFANLVSNSGRVYSFEFIPSNISVMEKNISLNLSLQSIVQIIKYPLWDTNDALLYYLDKGPGSKVESSKKYEDLIEIRTITLDSFVKKNNVSRVDFIKMDIEGAEDKALSGAVNTIKKFCPKLAISIYHNPEDFSKIIKIIDSLKLNYKFYIGHGSIHAEETVLFASVK